MEHIKIENTWESYNIFEKCKCSFYDTYSNLIKTEYCHENTSENLKTYLLKSMSSGSRLFTNDLCPVKYSNLIITNTVNGLNGRNKHLHIFDTIQDKIIFSSKYYLNEENQKLIERLRLLDNYYNCPNRYNDAKFLYDSIMMMENFMIIKFKNNYGLSTSYIVFNFKTQTYKLFIFCTLYIYNDKSVFVFAERDGIKIITKSDIDNDIDNVIEINFDYYEFEKYRYDGCGMDIYCMCNSNIITFRLRKIIADKYFTEYIYYDIKKRKNVYTSKNQFISWRGNRFIEYDKELNRCNSISFILDNIE